MKTKILLLMFMSMACVHNNGDRSVVMHSPSDLIKIEVQNETRRHGTVLTVVEGVTQTIGTVSAESGTTVYIRVKDSRWLTLGYELVNVEYIFWIKDARWIGPGECIALHISSMSQDSYLNECVN